jgi:hypothetical protein
VPEPLRGRRLVNVQLAYLGGAEDGAQLIAGLRDLGPELDRVGPLSPAGLMRLHGDPEGPTLAATDHALLDELPADAADALLGVCGPGTQSPLVNVELRHLGGALAEASDHAGAMATIDAAFALHTVGVPATPEVAGAIAERNAALRAALAPFGSGRAYLNFAGGPVRDAAAFDTSCRDRVDALCARLDRDRAMHTGYANA